MSPLQIFTRNSLWRRPFQSYLGAYCRKDIGRRFYSSFKDPYSVLGLKTDASTSEIKKAYFNLVKKYHPDTNKDPEAKTKFIEIQNAYEILSDPKRKEMFDQYGATEEHATDSNSSGPSGFGHGTAGFDPAEMFRNIFGGGGFGSGGNGGFETIFRTSGFNRAELDVTINLNLSFLDAAKGTFKTIIFPRLEMCITCDGKGVGKGSQHTTCRSCRGSGQETRIKGSFYFSSTCRTCGGLGQINPDPCKPCGGSGANKKTTTIQVEIPAGVADGEAFSVQHEGNRIGGQFGNLIVAVTVEKSPIFTRRKNDIYVNVPISLQQALLGGNIIVPTINGDVEMKIPSGTQPDDVKRMSGRGIYRSPTGEQGHQYVKFKVEIPRNLTVEQKDLLSRCFSSSDNPFTSDTNKSTDTNTSTSTTGSNNNNINKWLDKLRRWLQWY